MTSRSLLLGGLLAAFTLSGGMSIAAAQTAAPTMATEPITTIAPTVAVAPTMTVAPTVAIAPTMAVAPTAAAAPVMVAPTTAAAAVVTAARQTVVSEASVSIPAGGEARLPFNAFCLNFGEPFPKSVNVSSGRTTDDAVKVLKAAALSGTGSSDVLQTQLAVWNAIAGKYGYYETDVDLSGAKALTASAKDQSTAALSSKGVPLDEAIRDGKVSASVEGWMEASAPKALPGDAPYYGSGTLVIKNLGSSALEVYAPLGLVLKAAMPAEQDMGIYAVKTSTVVEQPKGLPQTGGGPKLAMAPSPILVLVPLVALLALVLLGARNSVPNKVEDGPTPGAW
ncbi:MAG: hypothetical protein IPJ58_01895 [Ardenticatenia bacterium]|nr:hypothetical protein [Ardenticatenia bacterium]